MKKNGISRRDFLKGAAAGAASVAAAGLLGACAPGEATAAETQAAAEGASGAAATEAATTEAATTQAATVAETTASVSEPAPDVMTAEKMAEVKWSFEVAPDPIADDQIAETIEHDVIVIGAGMSGLCCAVSAQDHGADVLLFSASSVPYARGGSNHAIGSKHQKEMGVDYTPELARRMVKVEQVSGTYHMDKQKWAKWVNHSGESMDWMIDIMEAKGLHVGLEAPYLDPDGVIETLPGSHNFYSDDQPLGVFFGAPLCAQAYADTFVERGGEIHYKTVAKQLIRENNNTGRVSAVVAQREDGSYVKYVGRKAIVMATGDFSTDADMMAKYSPWVYEHYKDKLRFETNYDNQFIYSGLMPGDGQKMGLWVGAAWQRTFPNPAAINGGAAGPAHAIISNFWGINLDINGRRYMNECTNFAYGGMAVLQLPEQTAFAVWSQDYAYTEEEWEPLGYVVGEGNGIKKASPEDMIAQWDAAQNYVKADTLEELIDQLYEGYKDEAKQTALASIRHYSECAKNGYDDEFQVNPDVLHPIENGPFYGTKTTGSTFLCVFGGLRTNDKMQVCEEDDTPIEGLYNVGTMTGDFYANSYNFVLPGQNLGACCLTLPYMLGKELAEM
ncbi:MAG: FAD-dependent oxidoreductase [Lachnospiraceae bacterium]|nr:FAD-dependent oxidoreductase [Lachnospiraceae bacterium]